MDPGLVAEVKHAVELSMKGDPESVKEADRLLGDLLPAKPGFLPALFTIAADASVSIGTYID